MSNYREQVYGMLGVKQEPQSDFKKEVYGMLGVKPDVTNWYEPSTAPKKRGYSHKAKWKPCPNERPCQ